VALLLGLGMPVSGPCLRGWLGEIQPGAQSFDPKTCLLTINQHGTYKLLSDTGAYTGISGSGKYQLSILDIGARSGGKCTQSKPPVAFHQVINVSGPVSLP
jgi:hypothetical protein